MESNFTYIKTIPFSEFLVWDVKMQFLESLEFAYPSVKLNEILGKASIEWEIIEDDKTYPILGVRRQGQGVYINREAIGKELRMKKYQKSKSYHFFYCKVRTVGGQMGVVYPEFENSYASSNMQYWTIDLNKILPEYLELILKIKVITDIWDKNAIGADGRHFNQGVLMGLEIPLPNLEEQNRLVANYKQKVSLANEQEVRACDLEKEIEKLLFRTLGINRLKNESNNSGLKFFNYYKLADWASGFNDISEFESTVYQNISININESIAEDVFRGKSPKYDKEGLSIILNQKCNRWNTLEIEHAKTVNDTWYRKIDRKFFTRYGDVLINSTGEGTIGRATFIKEGFENLLYDSHILLVRFNKDLINPLFFTLLFNSRYGQSQVENIKSAQSTKQTELGVNNIKKVSFPLPPIDIQNDIAIQLTRLEREIRELKEQAELNRKAAIDDFETEIFKS